MSDAKGGAALNALQLGGKASTDFAAAVHSHTSGDVTDFGAASAAAMGAKANSNPMNHNRYTDAEAVAAVQVAGFGNFGGVTWADATGARIPGVWGFPPGPPRSFFDQRGYIWAISPITASIAEWKTAFIQQPYYLYLSSDCTGTGYLAATPGGTAPRMVFSSDNEPGVFRAIPDAFSTINIFPHSIDQGPAAVACAVISQGTYDVIPWTSTVVTPALVKPNPTIVGPLHAEMQVR